MGNRCLARGESPALLVKCPLGTDVEAVAPTNVFLRLDTADQNDAKVVDVDLAVTKSSALGALYRPPEACPLEERQWLQLGACCDSSCRHAMTSRGPVFAAAGHRQ